MKILHVITDLRTGGAEKLMVDLLPMLRDAGHEVELCLFNGEDTPFLKLMRDSGIRIHTFGVTPNYYSPRNLLKLIKLSRHFDVVHTHNTAPQLFGAIASLTNNRKWILTEHTTTSHHRTWWYRPIERWMYGRYNGIIFISEAAKQSAVKVMGNKVREGLYVIPNGINISQYADALPIDKFSLGSKSKDKKILLMVGRYSYQKDQSTIIKAMSLLPSTVELWLAGHGETENELKNLISDLQLNDRVFLLGARSDVPNLLKTVDIVIQSSHIEGFGLAAVEAMAAGKPVIASDIPGMRDVVNDVGLLFEHGNYQQLSEQINILLNDGSQRSELIRKGLKRAEEYSLSKMTNNYLKIYESATIR